MRPGVPAPTDTRAFVVPDRPSPPLREDGKVRHCPLARCRSPGPLTSAPGSMLTTSRTVAGRALCVRAGRQHDLALCAPPPRPAAPGAPPRQPPKHPRGANIAACARADKILSKMGEGARPLAPPAPAAERPRTLPAPGRSARPARDPCPAAGTFGRVLECWDRKNKDYVAIKIVRNVQKYRDAAMIEVRGARLRPAAWWTPRGARWHGRGLGPWRAVRPGRASCERAGVRAARSWRC